ncbi:hypothetical protein SEA_C3PO_20 [Corynebacterium phage C3PO]|uniref:Uncharacterized protein n=1 Tax=Corynebacterium phage C3PO TaxID=2047868 RepID=A0A2H4P8L8_9CAUD|nr:hypothetical protein FDJ10_gp20 [Corynebacterium phage C3PO]ATW58449.1 hypothetical protein SEA_C3PO_20 [Corynebacterium phage C3PO]
MFFQEGPISRIDLEIWRRAEGQASRVASAWGDYVETSEPPVPALYGREKVETVFDCVMEPRTTRVETRPENNERMTFTGVTFFMTPYVDVRPDDFLVFRNVAGVLEVFKVEGEGGTNNYVSPFTGVVGGKEVFALRYRGAK